MKKLSYLIFVISFLVSIFLPFSSIKVNASKPEINVDTDMPVLDFSGPDEFIDEEFQPILKTDLSEQNYERIKRIEDPFLSDYGIQKEITPETEIKTYSPPSSEIIAQTQEDVKGFDCNTVNDVPIIECEALVALYESTNGAGWYDNTNWLKTNTVGDWSGVWVSQYGNVWQIKWLSSDNSSSTSNNLIGTIPAELGNLTNLRNLYLTQNQLSGVIPTEIGNLVNLNILDLSGTYDLCGTGGLSGSIPPELGNLLKLIQLNLRDNNFSGSIPVELSNLSYLTSINFFCINISGQIPVELSNLIYLQRLDFQGNFLSGNIPHEFGNLTSLKFLQLGSNQLSGYIPSSLSNLINLEVLFLNNNHFSGEIPAWFGNFPHLVELSLNNNEFSGIIPFELSNLSNLRALRLNDNLLTGSLPPEFSSLSNLSTLELNNNQITGSIPLSFTSLVILSRFIFNDTFICEPNDPEFLAWKETVSYWKSTGITCEANSTPWLLMYYLAGDNDLEEYANYFYETLIAQSNLNVKITIFIDDPETPLYFGKDKEFNTVIVKPELNTGDPQTLIDFINWSKLNYSAEKTALTIFDHGNALSGIAWDDSSKTWYYDFADYLDPSELKSVFQEVGKVNVLHLYACLMANLEAAYQIRGYTDFIIGSENEGVVFNYTEIFSKYIPFITNVTTPEELSIFIADSYFMTAKPESIPSNISVLKMSEIDNVASKTSNLANFIRSHPEKMDYVWAITESGIVQRFDSTNNGEINDRDYLADLYDFALHLGVDQDFKPVTEELITALNEFIIFNEYWSGIFTIDDTTYTYILNDSHGISIGLPRSSISFYNPDWLDFAVGADWLISPTSSSFLSNETESVLSWGAFISEMVLAKNPEEPDQSEPSPLVSPITYEIERLFLPILLK